MIKDLKNEMENSEFSQMVNDAVNNDAQDSYLFCITPLWSSYGDYSSNISVSVANMFAGEGFYGKGIEEKDEDNNRIFYHYYSKDGIEIFNIIKQNSFTSTTEICYAFKGEQKLIDKYRFDIQDIIDVIIDESVDESVFEF